MAHYDETGLVVSLTRPPVVEYRALDAFASNGSVLVKGARADVAFGTSNGTISVGVSRQGQIRRWARNADVPLSRIETFVDEVMIQDRCMSLEGDSLLRRNLYVCWQLFLANRIVSAFAGTAKRLVDAAIFALAAKFSGAIDALLDVVERVLSYFTKSAP